MNDKRWLTPKKFEEEFGVKESTQANWRREGRVPFSKWGGFIFYDRKKIDATLEDHDS